MLNVRKKCCSETVPAHSGDWIIFLVVAILLIKCLIVVCVVTTIFYCGWINYKLLILLRMFHNGIEPLILSIANIVMLLEPIYSFT